MFKNKPVSLLVAAGLVVALISVTVAFQFFGGTVPSGMTNGQGFERPSGDFQPGEMPEGFTPPEGGNGNPRMGEGGMPPDGSREFPSGPDSNRQDFQSSGFSDNSITFKLMQLLRGVQLGGIFLIALLGILSIIGILMSMKWGRTLAIVTAILSLVSTVPTLLMRFIAPNWIESAVKILLAIAITVLCLLPKSKQVIEPAA